MNEIRKSAKIALLTSVPITLVCWLSTWALIHASDSTQRIAGVFLAPALGLIWVWQRFDLDGDTYWFIPLALLAQFVGYFLVILLARQVVRTVRVPGLD